MRRLRKPEASARESRRWVFPFEPRGATINTTISRFRSGGNDDLFASRSLADASGFLFRLTPDTCLGLVLVYRQKNNAAAPSTNHERDPGKTDAIVRLGERRILGNRCRACLSRRSKTRPMTGRAARRCVTKADHAPPEIPFPRPFLMYARIAVALAAALAVLIVGREFSGRNERSDLTDADRATLILAPSGDVVPRPTPKPTSLKVQIEPPKNDLPGDAKQPPAAYPRTAAPKLVAPKRAEKEKKQHRPPSSARRPGDLVQFAGGTIQWRAPAGWKLYEFPLARTVRVVAVPRPLADFGALPGRGIWLEVNAVAAEKKDGRSPLDAHLQAQLRRLGGDRNVLLKRELRIAGQPALHVRYRPVNARKVENELFVIDLPTGRLSLHFALDGSNQQRQAVIAAVIDSLVFRAPKAPSETPVLQVRAAKDVLGSWKAFRSRMRFFPDGRVEIERDRVVDLSEIPAVGEEILRGRFTAEGDVLRIVWSDGSKLNFRRKIRGADLLLTDHLGRISQLRRITE